MRTPKNVIQHPSAPRKRVNTKSIKISPELLGASRRRKRLAVDNSLSQFQFNPFVAPKIHPGVLPEGEKANPIAQDEFISPSFGWAQTVVNSAWAEGQIFPGYAELSLLAIRPEYRVIAETLASEHTREWIVFKSTGKEDKTDKIKQLDYAVKKKFNLQDIARKAIEHDAFFGRAHIFINCCDIEDRDELKTNIGNGKGPVSQVKVKKRELKSFKNIEPVWVYPTRYNSNDPLSDDWYKPGSWYVMAKEVDSSRLLTLITREIPDLLKPAYSFGGLSMSQMVKPYVDNWLRTRQAVADLIYAFSVFVLKTDLVSQLGPGAQILLDRIEFFVNCKNNLGLMTLNKDTEEFENVSASLGTLDQLQAQTQEHMAAVSRIPLVKLLGIQPAGLNASSEGEIRVFYDSIAASQEAFVRGPLETLICFIQLNEWGEVDPEIEFDFKGLWQLDEAGKAAIEKTKADIDTAYLTDGVVSPEEVRSRIASDKESQYQGLELDPDVLPQQPGMEGEEGLEDLFGGEEGGEEEGNEELKPKDPASRLASSITNKAANFGGAATGGFKGDLGLADLLQDKTKVDKETATYTDDSTTPQHCAACTMFVPPDDCTTVEGPINPEGWCKYFKQRDDVELAKDEFSEQDHPRASGSEHGGEFVKKGEGGGPKTQSKAQGHLISEPDKTKWPSHIQKLKIPPAWTDVKISLDPKTPLQAVGKDAKGRGQYIYSERFKESQAAKKFARIKKLDNKYDSIKKQNESALKSRNPIIREHASITALVMEMGLRPGSEKETWAEEKAYGATTLQSDHVVIDGNETRLQFIGKKGVKINLPITDPFIAEDIRERAAKGGPLFPGVSDKSLRAYVGKLNGGGFKTKDLRTLKGTSIANDIVSRTPAPTSKAAYKKAVKAVAEVVSQKLGNTPTVALQSYISPTVFAPWQGVLHG